MSKHIKIYYCLVQLILICYPNLADKSHRPLAVIHGILTGGDGMQVITDRIQEVKNIIKTIAE